MITKFLAGYILFSVWTSVLMNFYTDLYTVKRNTFDIITILAWIVIWPYVLAGDFKSYEGSGILALKEVEK